MAMKFDRPRCPECGEWARGTCELVPALALLDFTQDGEAEYQGETEMDWDGQTTLHDQEGRATLECRNCHRWPARLTQDDDSDDQPAMQTVRNTDSGG